MWNSVIWIGCKRALQNRYQRLVAALSLSLLLHLFLIGEFEIGLPEIDKPSQLIEARLLIEKPPMVEKPLPEEPVKKSPPKPVKKTPNIPKPVEPAIISPEPDVIEDADIAMPEAALPTQIETLADGVAVTATDDDAAAPENVEETLDTKINPNAYKYVETTFDVRTEVSENVDSSAAGKATIVYALQDDLYQLKSLMQPKGLAALVIPDLTQTSEGFLSATGLQPRRYVYQFGDKKNKSYSADFDWEQKKLSLHTTKRDQTVALLAGTQDLLSFMYQFMFVPPLQNMQLNITNGKKLGTYDYVFEGEESIATKMGQLNTIHIARTDTDGDEKTELWLALDYQYVPVKIRKTEKEDKVYELLVTSLKTEKAD